MLEQQSSQSFCHVSGCFILPVLNNWFSDLFVALNFCDMKKVDVFSINFQRINYNLIIINVAIKNRCKWYDTLLEY